MAQTNIVCPSVSRTHAVKIAFRYQANRLQRLTESPSGLILISHRIRNGYNIRIRQVRQFIMEKGSVRGEETYRYYGGPDKGSFFFGDGVDFGPPMGSLPLAVGGVLPDGVEVRFSRFSQIADDDAMAG